MQTSELELIHGKDDGDAHHGAIRDFHVVQKDGRGAVVVVVVAVVVKLKVNPLDSKSGLVSSRFTKGKSFASYETKGLGFRHCLVHFRLVWRFDRATVIAARQNLVNC